MVCDMPAEAQRWTDSLDDGFRRATDHMLQIVGEEAFAKHWRVYRDQVRKLEYDFDL
jgi:hypothetical protein